MRMQGPSNQIRLMNNYNNTNGRLFNTYKLIKINSESRHGSVILSKNSLVQIQHFVLIHIQFDL